MVERHVANVNVVGSNPITRSCFEVMDASTIKRVGREGTAETVGVTNRHTRSRA